MDYLTLRMLSDFSDKPLGKIASYLCEKNNPNMGGISDSVEIFC